MKNLKIYSFTVGNTYKVMPVSEVRKEMYHHPKYQQYSFQELLDKEMKNKEKIKGKVK